MSPFKLRTGPSIFTTSRTRLYFTKKEWLEVPFRAVTTELGRHDEVRRLGLVASYEDFEYPLWIMLRQSMRRMPEIRNVFVASPSHKLDRPEPVDAVVCLHCLPEGRRRIEADGFRWALGDDVQLFFTRHPGRLGPT